MADTKITGLTAIASLATEDLFAVVDDPSGTPVTKKATGTQVRDLALGGFGTGVLTWLNTPSSANLASAVTDETGSGSLVFGTSPTISTKLTLTGATETTSNPVLDATQTWNAGAVTFTGLKLNVTNTASAAASRLIDLQIGGTSYFNVTRAGVLTLYDGTRGPSLLPFTGSYAGFQVSRDGTNVGDVHANTYWAGPNHGTLTCAYTQYGVQLNNVANVQWSNGSTYSGADTMLYRDGAAATLAQRNSTNAQTFRLYRTYTDGSNYLRLALQTGADYVEVAAETAGTGADDVDLRLTPAGTGNVRFGTHSALGGETVTGYITIKDSGGTSRKIAVVS